MSGNIIDDGLAVNYWVQSQQKMLRFLTNIHYCNSKITISKDIDRIFTTERNAEFLAHRLENPKPEMVALPLNHRLRFVDESLNLHFCATFIDANYSPGSAMILFEGTKYGNILYTGSCRYTSEMSENPVLKEYIDGQKKLDKMYLDTKYLCPGSVPTLPTKRNVLFTVANIIRNNPAHKIHIGVDKCVKEEVLIALSNLVNEQMWIDQQTLDTLNLLGVKNMFTTEKTKCNIFIHSLINHLFDKLRLSEHVIKIILRAQMHTEASEKFRNCIEWAQKRIYFFPYAAHSTPHELKEMLQKLKPAQVIPINLLANDNTYAEQFVMDVTNAWAEKLPIAFVKRKSEEDKLYFWKNVGKMKRVLQSDDFYYCKQSSIIDLQEAPTKQNDSKTAGKRKMPQYSVDSKKTKLYLNCDKIANSSQEVSREVNGEHEWNFQSEHEESSTVVHQNSGGTLNEDYTNCKVLQRKNVTHVTKTGSIKKSMNTVSSYQVSNNTRQRRQHKALNEAKLKELCLKSKCFVHVTNISSKMEYFNYLGLKPR